MFVRTRAATIAAQRPWNTMTSVFILRRHILDARRSQAALEATRDLRVAGVTDSLPLAGVMLSECDPDVLLADLSLPQGTLLSLLHEMCTAQQPSPRPRVIVVVTGDDDPLLFSAVRAGADSHLRERDASAPAPAIGRLLRGEATASALVARQALAFFGLQSSSALALDERSLDWSADAHNPLRLSRAEQHMLRLLGEQHGVGEIALRMGVSVESIGRRIANVYRKIRWDVRSGALSLQAA
jgi:DNA-binding NarL/FixJ family response regulator